MLLASITLNHRRRKTNVTRLWVACFVIAPAVWGQEAAAFHISTREVLVDAAVVDKKGNFERGLAREDFRLWEDGKEQKITSFSLESQAGLDRRNERYVALVFDDDRPGLRDEVIQFIGRFASPGFHMAVFSRVDSKMVLQQAFTEDAEQIKTVLRAMKVTAGKPMQGGGPGFNPFFERVNTVAIALAPVRGRKALILFSYGYFSYRGGAVLVDGRYLRARDLPPVVALLSRTVGICNAAHVSIYAFAMGKDAGVSYDYYTRPEDPAKDVGGVTDLVHDLAVGTGGKYMPPGKYDLVAYLGDVSNEPSEYYLLGFEPRARSSEEPCHSVNVKVAGKGVRVIARDSYCSQ